MILCVEGHARIYLYRTLNLGGNGRKLHYKSTLQQRKRDITLPRCVCRYMPPYVGLSYKTPTLLILVQEEDGLASHTHPVCWFRRAGHTAAPVDDLLYQNNRKQNKDCLVSWRWNISLGCNTTPPGTRIEATQPQPPRLRFQNNTLWWSSYWLW